MSNITKFNIRVYGLFINVNKEILLTDEDRFDMQMTKFPGGGLHFGEGTADCLHREALEEFGQEIEIIEHFYTTDFFQPARFFKDQQLLSIYYLAKFKEAIRFPLSEKAFDFKTREGEIISFRFISIEKLEPSMLTFPIDRYVLKLLKEKF